LLNTLESDLLQNISDETTQRSNADSLLSNRIAVLETEERYTKAEVDDLIETE
jgi:hypothetical protein